jgi:hypothetical protein
MSHSFYNFLHLVGIFLVLSSLGAIALHTFNGGTKNYSARKWVAAIHGSGLLIIFVAGFGLMARLGMVGQGAWPKWIFIKIGVWLTLGLMPILLYRKSNLSSVWALLTITLASIAAWTAINKPFLD